MLNNRLLFLVLACATALTLAGCGSQTTKPGHPTPAPEMYQKAKSAVDSAYWARAIPRLQNLAATYPFGDYAIQAELDLIYAYHMVGDADSAVDEAQRFIREHPRNKHVPYALYMQGIARFPENLSGFAGMFSISPAGFDADNVLKSFKAFHDLVQRFPNSTYSPDARQRMTYLRNRLAANDLHVGRYYLRRGAWLSAVRRAQHVLNNYSQTPSTPAAIKMMIKGYQKLGLDELAQNAKKLLAANQKRYSTPD